MDKEKSVSYSLKDNVLYFAGRNFSWILDYKIDRYEKRMI